VAVLAPTLPAPAAATTRSRRIGWLLAVGLLDSFGMTLGWTVFSLLVLQAGGLAVLGVCNAAMLVGVAASAPASGWLSRRLDGRRLLRLTAAVEASLRVASFALLLAGAPLPVLLAVIVVTYTAGLTGYAAMRAEVSAVSRPGRAGATMTLFVVAVSAVEAAGVASAALLPGATGGVVLPVVVAVYGLSQLPTWLVAGGALVGKAQPPGRSDGRASVGLPLVAGGLVMLLGSGPALLAVGLVAALYGPRWVAVAAIAFTGGMLLAPAVIAALDRLRLPASVLWPAWGVGMVAGWTLAPFRLWGLLAAQVMAGLSIAAFEGSMDAHIAALARGQLTRNLAASEAVRALGSAAAVALLPVLVDAGQIGELATAAGGLLLAATAVALLVQLLRMAGLVNAGPILDWRGAPMRQDMNTEAQIKDWEQAIRRSRRHPRRRRAVAVLTLLLVGGGMFALGRQAARNSSAAAPPVTALMIERGPVAPATTRPAPTTTRPPAARTLRLVTRNIRSEANPNRVYLAPGQVGVAQARRGQHPVFRARPGERLRVRVDNQDRLIHSFTFAPAKLNLDAWEGAVTARTFKAPRKPGTYQFYCRYRKVGMAGTLVVR
jgi:plastocyanin